MWKGTVLSIHIAPGAADPTQSVSEARVVMGKGLDGDRYFHGRGTWSSHPGTGRHITLIESETLEALERVRHYPYTRRFSTQRADTRRATQSPRGSQFSRRGGSPARRAPVRTLQAPGGPYPTGRDFGVAAPRRSARECRSGRDYPRWRCGRGSVSLVVVPFDQQTALSDCGKKLHDGKVVCPQPIKAPWSAAAPSTTSNRTTTGTSVVGTGLGRGDRPTRQQFFVGMGLPLMPL